jgi:protein-disulfide isomerase
MKSKLDAVIAVTLVGCALITTGLVVRREFFAQTLPAARAVEKPVFVADWRNDRGKGVRLGAADAPVQLIEFADFECPFCAEFHKVLKVTQGIYPTMIGLTYVHFPIPGHRFAIPAARVAECAGEQGLFEVMHDRLFEQQDRFGLKPWVDIAKETQVPDIPAFETCVKKTDQIRRVAEGQALGKQLNIQGTPTVIVNGWKLARPPTADELDNMVKAILAGGEPVTSDGKFAK